MVKNYGWARTSGVVMGMLIVYATFFVGIACGYGVREMISRRRRAEARRKYQLENAI